MDEESHIEFDENGDPYLVSAASRSVVATAATLTGTIFAIIMFV